MLKTKQEVLDFAGRLSVFEFYLKWIMKKKKLMLGKRLQIAYESYVID